MSDAPGIVVTPLGNGRFLVDTGERWVVAYAAVSGSKTWVFIGGRTSIVDAASRAGGARTGARDDLSLASPMPATVVAINVEAGRDVARGDVLIMLEAMKMELPIKAPRDGRVKTVGCRVGELVQPGVPLLELE